MESPIFWSVRAFALIVTGRGAGRPTGASGSGGFVAGSGAVGPGVAGPFAGGGVSTGLIVGGVPAGASSGIGLSRGGTPAGHGLVAGWGSSALRPTWIAITRTDA